MTTSIRESGSSSNCKASLRVGSIDYPLASVGPQFCVLRSAQDIPINSRAELIVSIDESQFVWNVVLPYGGVPYDERVEFIVEDAAVIDRSSTR